MKASFIKMVLAAVCGLGMVNCTVKGSSKAFPVNPGNSPQQPGAPKSPAPATFLLKAGDYKPVAGNLNACPQNIGVADQNNVVMQLFVTLMSPCDGSTILFTCEGGTVCRGNGAVLTITSETGYDYNDEAKGWSATFGH